MHIKLHQKEKMALITSSTNIDKNEGITDAGATGKFHIKGAPVISKKITTDPISITLLDGEKLTSTHKCELNLPDLPPVARETTLCDTGCRVTYDNEAVTVFLQNQNHMGRPERKFYKIMDPTTENMTVIPKIKTNPTARSIFSILNDYKR